MKTDKSNIPYNINVKGLVKCNNTIIVPIGSMAAYNGPTPPKGWLICDGTIINPNEYPELSKILATTYGVANKLPDLRERTIIGTGMGPNLTNRTLGMIGGTEKHTLTTNEIPSHIHGLGNSGEHNHEYMLAESTDLARGNDNGWAIRNISSRTSNDSTASHTHTTDPTGGGQSHNNMMPYLTLNYIIRAK